MSTPIMDEIAIEAALQQRIKEQAAQIAVALGYLHAGKPKLASEVLKASAGSDAGGCQPNCGHTESEHRSFDRGVTSGRMRGFQVSNPYDPVTEPPEWDAWENGVSAGRCEYNATKRQNVPDQLRRK